MRFAIQRLILFVLLAAAVGAPVRALAGDQDSARSGGLFWIAADPRESSPLRWYEDAVRVYEASTLRRKPQGGAAKLVEKYDQHFGTFNLSGLYNDLDNQTPKSTERYQFFSGRLEGRDMLLETPGKSLAAPHSRGLARYRLSVDPRQEIPNGRVYLLGLLADLGAGNQKADWAAAAVRRYFTALALPPPEPERRHLEWAEQHFPLVKDDHSRKLLARIRQEAPLTAEFGSQALVLERFMGEEAAPGVRRMSLKMKRNPEYLRREFPVLAEFVERSTGAFRSENLITTPDGEPVAEFVVHSGRGLDIAWNALLSANGVHPHDGKYQNPGVGIDPAGPNGSSWIITTNGRARFGPMVMTLNGFRMMTRVERTPSSIGVTFEVTDGGRIAIEGAATLRALIALFFRQDIEDIAQTVYTALGNGDRGKGMKIGLELREGQPASRIIFSAAVPVAQNNFMAFMLRLVSTYYGDRVRAREQLAALQIRLFDNIYQDLDNHRKIRPGGAAPSPASAASSATPR
ncbi:MAG: hypothetical protein GMKNLPBB_00126 [Myxococcota bacterium]|nr:hypothetical protein [Myxococcota bacterium]